MKLASAPDDPMHKVIREEATFELILMDESCHHLFDRAARAERGVTNLQAFLEARSPRSSDLSHKMAGSPLPR